MKSVRVFEMLLFTLLLVACGNVKKEEKPDDIFRGELRKIYNISEEGNKEILDIISKDIVSKVLEKEIDFNSFKGINTEYNEISEGIINNSAGEKKGCFKLPVRITFNGTEEQVKSLIDSIGNISSRISAGDISIEKKEGLFKLDCEVNFFGKSKDDKSGVSSENSSVQMIQGADGEVDKISLRDFDLLMALRPSNSDAASITFEFADDSLNDGNSDSDANDKKDIEIIFTKEQGKYYCEISLDKRTNKKQIALKDKKIIFDILSCKREEDSDKIGADIALHNTTDKILSISVFDDPDKRINIIDKKGSIEVVK